MNFTMLEESPLILFIISMCELGILKIVPIPSVLIQNYILIRRGVRTLNFTVTQGRSQELEMGGAKLLGEGSGGRLRPPVGPGQSPGRGAKGGKAPRKL